jgi:hypothetical protein
MIKKIVYCAALLAVFCCVPGVQAAPFQNGDFSQRDTGWYAVLGSTSAGGVSFNTGYVELSTGLNADPYSAAIVQGDDGSFTFATPITLGPDTASLLFDAKLIQILANNSEPVGALHDHVSVTVYDALGTLPDKTYDPGIDFTVFALNAFTLDVSAYRGRNIALEFTLANENDGWYSKATLQNIRFADGTFGTGLPEPSTLLLLGAGGLAGLRAKRPSRRG